MLKTLTVIKIIVAFSESFLNNNFEQNLNGNWNIKLPLICNNFICVIYLKLLSLFFQFFS